MAGIPSLSGTEGVVGFGMQADKDTPATDIYNMLMLDCNVGLDVVEADDVDEIGGDLDESAPERYGHQGVPVDGQMRCRPYHMGLVLQAYGLKDVSGGLRIYTGVNDKIRVTDDGGTVTVNILTGTGATLVAGEVYTPTEFAAGLKAALDGDTTLSETYTVTYSTSTNKWTISHAGSTLSLLWDTGADSAVKLLGHTLGFVVSADDTGSTSYESDVARDYTGRWKFKEGEHDTIRVTDDGGSASVDILAGDGAVLLDGPGYNAWQVCAGLQAAFDGDTTLTEGYTVTFDESTNKFTIANDGTTLELNMTHVDNNIDVELGYTATEHTGATTYTSDNAILPAAKHTFHPQASENYPYASILDQYATGSFAVLAEAVRLLRLEFDMAERSPVTLAFSGRGINRGDPSGSEVEHADTGNFTSVNTATGHVRFYDPASAPEAYRAISMNTVFETAELIEPQLTAVAPYNIAPGRRSANGTMTIGLGAEDSGGAVRAALYGADAGTEPSNTIVVRAMDVMFNSGQTVPSQVGTTEKYGLQFEAKEVHLRNFNLDRLGGGFEQGTFDLRYTRKNDEWYITLVNDAPDALYKAPNY